MPGVPGVPGVPRVPGVTGVARVARVAGVTRCTGVPRLAGLIVVAGLVRLIGLGRGPGVPGGYWGSRGVPGFPGGFGLSGLVGWAVFAQRLPKAGFSPPTTVTVFPQAFTGTSTGACTWLPDSRPGEFAARPDAAAPESACA
ncbi:hypothetical protein GCM10020254_65320 [Streptomyces goshikiensis]